MFRKILCSIMALAVFSTSALAGTASVTSLTRTTWGNKRVTMGTVTLSGAYGTSGIACTANQLGLTSVDRVIFLPSGTGDTFEPKWASGYITLTVPTMTSQALKPAVAPTSADSVRVRNKALTAADQETANVYVTVMPGTGGSIAALGAMTTLGGTTEANKLYTMFMAADSSTMFWMADTLDHPWVRLLDASWVNADSVYFDYNGTNRTSRLYYTGTNLSNLGDLYVPYKNGKFIKITKTTGAGLYAAGAKLLYYVRADANYDDDKLQCDVAGSVDNYNGFMADSTYTTLPYFRVVNAAPYSSSNNFTAVYNFIAIGN